MADLSYHPEAKAEVREAAAFYERKRKGLGEHPIVWGEAAEPQDSRPGRLSAARNRLFCVPELCPKPGKRLFQGHGCPEMSDFRQELEC